MQDTWASGHFARRPWSESVATFIRLAAGVIVGGVAQERWPGGEAEPPGCQGPV